MFHFNFIFWLGQQNLNELSINFWNKSKFNKTQFDSGF